MPETKATQPRVPQKNTLEQACAFHYLLVRGWSIQAAMHYVLANPEFVKAAGGK